MHLLKSFDCRYTTTGETDNRAILVQGTASVVDANLKRVFLLDRITMEVLSSTLVKADNTWEMYTPPMPADQILLIGLDDGENFNVDGFDLVNAESVAMTKHIDDIADDCNVKFRDFRRKFNLLQDSDRYAEFVANIQTENGEPVDIHNEAGLLSVTDSADIKVVDVKYSGDIEERLKGEDLNSLEIVPRPNTNTSLEMAYAVITLDVSGISSTITNAVFPIRIEDYPDVVEEFNEYNGFYVTTLAGDQLSVELSDWDESAGTGVLWVIVPSLDPTDPPVLLFTAKKPLTSNLVFDGVDEVCVIEENVYLKKYDKDQNLLLTSDNRWYSTQCVAVDEEGYMFTTAYAICSRINKDTGANDWSTTISGYGRRAFVYGPWVVMRTSVDKIYILDRETGDIYHSFDLMSTDGVDDLMVVTPEGRCIAGVGQTVFEEFDIESKTKIRNIYIPENSVNYLTKVLALTPNKKLVFYESRERSIQKVDLATGEIELHSVLPVEDGNKTVVYCIEPLSDGGYIVALSDSNMVMKLNEYLQYVWSDTTVAKRIRGLCVDGSNNIYVTGDDNKLHKYLSDGTYDWGQSISRDGLAVGTIRLIEIPYGRYFHWAYDTIRTPMWPSNFDGVYHMDNIPSGAGTIKDATANNNHMTPTGMDVGNLVDSVLGKGLSFNGIDELLTLAGLYASEQAAGQIDIVFKTSSNNGTLIAQDASGWNNLDSVIGIGQCGVIDPGLGYPVFETHGPNTSESRGVSGSSQVNDGNVHVLTVKWDGTNYTMVLDGVVETPVATTEGFWGADGATDILVGASSDTGPNFSGEIAEIHIHNAAQSDDYNKLFHKAVLGTLLQSQYDENTFELGIDVALAFDNSKTFKVYTGSAWRAILTNDASVHGGSDDGSWYIRNDSSGDVTYETSGVWISNPINCNGGVNIVETLVEWTQNIPTNTTLVVKTAWETSETEPTTPPTTWDTVTKGGSISSTSADSTNKWLWIRIELDTTDSSESPLIENLKLSIGYEVIEDLAGEDCYDAATFADYYSISNLDAVGETLQLGTGGDSGYRISKPIDLSSLFNYQSMEMLTDIDVVVGSRLIPVYTTGIDDHFDVGQPYNSHRNYNSSYKAWYMLNENTGNYWQPNVNLDYPLHFGYSFKTPVIAESMLLYFPGFPPYGYQLQGSNNGKDWTLIHGRGGGAAPTGEEIIIDSFSEGNQKEAYRFYRVFIPKGSTICTRVSEFQLYTSSLQLYGAIVDSLTEPTTPPSESSFVRLYPGEHYPGLEPGDDLTGKWLWLKTVVECDSAKPILSRVKVKLSGTETKEITFNSSDEWDGYNTLTDLSYGVGLGLQAASGAWERGSSSNVANLLAAAFKKTVNNRMQAKALEDLTNTEFVAGGYDDTEGHLHIGMAMFNKGEYVSLENNDIKINGTRYLTTDVIDLPAATVGSFAKAWWSFKVEPDYDYSGLEVSSMVTGGTWQVIASSGSQITGLEATTDMTDMQLQFRVKLPENVPDNFGLQFFFRVR